MTDSEKLVLEEKAKRKELSRVRIFWFLLAASFLLAICIVIQVMIIVGN